MPNFPKKLEKKLQKRIEENAFRNLPKRHNLVDFSSNDYLGLAHSSTIEENAKKLLIKDQQGKHGATGSRLLTGNHTLYDELESFLSSYYQTESALVFNSGYDANIGLLSSVPQRGDFVFYDELIHASIRDGITMGQAKSYKFDHNDVKSLKEKVEMVLSTQSKSDDTGVYVVTESVFSMDGDSPDLKKFTDFCSEQGFHFIVDEAHAVGVFGKGLVPQMQISEHIFARIITFGKAMGCHGAAILGSKALKEYLVNFARSLIYTTALPPHTLATILDSYTIFEKEGIEREERLNENIACFKAEVERLDLKASFIQSNSAIHCMMLSGNKEVKLLSQKLHDEGFDVKPILSPTVKAGEERLRFCLHAYNTKEEITKVLSLIKEEM